MRDIGLKFFGNGAREMHACPSEAVRSFPSSVLFTKMHLLTAAPTPFTQCFASQCQKLSWMVEGFFFIMLRDERYSLNLA